MSITVTAIYEDGVLRPLTPLALPEHTTVEIAVQPVANSKSQEHRLRVRHALVAAGIATDRPTGTLPNKSLSPERRMELAQRFASKQPMSDIIAEERQGR
jgi:predicted DNA-binding antitoxin AbrB/MazE fold protein